MIAPEVKKAWAHYKTRSRLYHGVKVPEGVSALFVLADAFIEAEWQRRKAEFRAGHSHKIAYPCRDGRHFQSDAKWREIVLEELREP